MIIGVDCDGVLTDMMAYIFHYGEKWFGRKPEKCNSINPSDIFGCTKRQEVLFATRYFFTYCKKWKPRKDARAVLRKLKKDGHELYQITARKFASGNNPLGLYSRYIYKKWLKENKFNFDGIFFCSDHKGAPEKLKGIRHFSADIMIDDRPDIAFYLAEKGVKVLLFNTPYNKDVSHKNITRVYDWKDVYRKISQIADK
ncbi:MAG: hypothetical protein NC205_06580 [Prevotella sp.]|nr:hypothetical protein [Alistipes senegalensis]MCM1358243.1 hypothetical protein [Prevotella sp.]MCM1473719.1 hypothetical protein [Muribaculaceae bacterium]